MWAPCNIARILIRLFGVVGVSHLLTYLHSSTWIGVKVPCLYLLTTLLLWNVAWADFVNKMRINVRWTLHCFWLFIGLMRALRFFLSSSDAPDLNLIVPKRFIRSVCVTFTTAKNFWSGKFQNWKLKIF